MVGQGGKLLGDGIASRQRVSFPSAIIFGSRLSLTMPFGVGMTMVGYRTRATSTALVGLLLFASEAAPQPPTVPEAPASRQLDLSRVVTFG